MTRSKSRPEALLFLIPVTSITSSVKDLCKEDAVSDRQYETKNISKVSNENARMKEAIIAAPPPGALVSGAIPQYGAPSSSTTKLEGNSPEAAPGTERLRIWVQG